MRDDLFKLLTILADGDFHSGQAMAEYLGTTRAVICNRVAALRGYGLDIHAVTGKGYRLVQALEVFDRSRISAALAQHDDSTPARLEIFRETASTNHVLMETMANGPIHRHVCMAEYQSAGRGRRGRRWVAPFGSSVCLSIGWCFDPPPDSPVALSLVVGVALMRVLSGLGLDAVGLKWPNDVLFDGRKLAGILIEMKGESAGPCQVAIGIGVNVYSGSAMFAQVEQPWSALDEILDSRVSRNRLAIAMVRELFQTLPAFQSGGFADFHAQWRRYDLIEGKRVVLSLPTGEVVGQARGVDRDGALLLAVDGTLCRYTSGDVSLRVAA